MYWCAGYGVPSGCRERFVRVLVLFSGSLWDRYCGVELFSARSRHLALDERTIGPRPSTF